MVVLQLAGLIVIKITFTSFGRSIYNVETRKLLRQTQPYAAFYLSIFFLDCLKFKFFICLFFLLNEINFS